MRSLCFLNPVETFFFALSGDISDFILLYRRPILLYFYNSLITVFGRMTSSGGKSFGFPTDLPKYIW